MRIVSPLAGAAMLSVALLGAGVARAEQEKRVSPHETVTASIGGVRLTVEYGRPFKKKREIFGGLVPYDKIWRTGADEATTLTTDGEITLGDLKVPKGRYALFTVPAKSKWQLILSKNANQWGAFSYDAHDDLGKTVLTLGAAKSPVEQFTIVVASTGAREGVLSINWDQTTASAAITTRR